MRHTVRCKRKPWKKLNGPVVVRIHMKFRVHTQHSTQHETRDRQEIGQAVTRDGLALPYPAYGFTITLSSPHTLFHDNFTLSFIVHSYHASHERSTRRRVHGSAACAVLGRWVHRSPNPLLSLILYERRPPRLASAHSHTSIRSTHADCRTFLITCQQAHPSYGSVHPHPS